MFETLPGLTGYSYRIFHSILLRDHSERKCLPGYHCSCDILRGNAQIFQHLLGSIIFAGRKKTPNFFWKYFKPAPRLAFAINGCFVKL